MVVYRTVRALPVGDKDAVDTSRDAASLGRFYGPRHEEVGGVFQFDAINGAFGAIRQ